MKCTAVLMVVETQVSLTVEQAHLSCLHCIVEYQRDRATSLSLRLLFAWRSQTHLQLIFSGRFKDTVASVSQPRVDTRNHCFACSFKYICYFHFPATFKGICSLYFAASFKVYCKGPSADVKSISSTSGPLGDALSAASITLAPQRNYPQPGTCWWVTPAKSVKGVFPNKGVGVGRKI